MVARGWSAGSQWLRWDPHLHAPGTLRNNQYPKDDDAAWAAFFQAIRAATPGVSALGITDYFSLRSYKKFVSARPADLESLFVFPNVEMRLTVETRGGQGVNIHLLISPEDSDHVARAEDQIRRLQLGIDGEDYPCSDDGLTRLGRRYLVAEPTAPPDQALAEGANQFKVGFDKLQDLFKRSQWLQRNVLVAISAGNDGLGGFSKDSSFWLLREEMARFANVIFSGQPNERQFWLNEDHLAKNGLRRKPCLHGSDAHELAKVLKPAEDRLCWIKGDASFESLRQTLVEPERRVWVGSEPPSEAAGASTIKALEVEAAPWLKTTEVSLNSGLVTIIGAKGSGKTALADLIALAAEAQEEEPNPASFLQKARDLLGSLKADLAWADGSESSAGVGGQWLWEQPRVQYLSQQFVERLSAADGLAEPLVAEIERVVFSAIPTDGRMETSSLAELRDVMLDDCRLNVEYQQGVIRDQTGTLAIEHEVKQSLKQRRAILDAAKRSLALLEDQLKKLPVDAGTEAKIAELGVVNRDVHQLQTLIAASQRRLVALQGIVADVHRIETQASDAVTRLRTPNPELLKPEVWESLIPKVATAAYETLKGIGDQTELEMKAYRENGLQSSGLPPARSLATLQAEKARLDKELGEVDSRAKTRAQIEGQLPAARQAVVNAQKEVDWALGADARGQLASGKRLKAYEALFQALSTEQATLEGLYQPLLERINEDPKLRKLSFTVGRVVDLDAWVSRGEGLFDLRSQPFMGRGALRGIAKEELLPAWRQGEPASVRQALADLYEKYFVNEPRPTVTAGTTPADVGDWLFSTSHIRVQYGIEYEGVPISRLSPGTRGIVLLTLYLGLDKWDGRPLVIDQPEENLDPSSIQVDLVPFFRDAATRRQIIMVTHNANLVVNTDSDQVIVASSQRQATNALPDISYRWGGLEDPHIREDVLQSSRGWC